MEKNKEIKELENEKIVENMETVKEKNDKKIERYCELAITGVFLTACTYLGVMAIKNGLPIKIGLGDLSLSIGEVA